MSPKANHKTSDKTNHKTNHKTSLKPGRKTSDKTRGKMSHKMSRKISQQKDYLHVANVIYNIIFTSFMTSLITAFCPSGLGSHTSIRAKFMSAQACPHCNQGFQPVESIDLTAPDDDSTEELPTSPPPPPPPPRPPIRRRTRGVLSSTTIPSRRSGSMPAGYERSTLSAIQGRQESIAHTRRNDPMVVAIQASFWVASGIYEMVGDVKTVEYRSPPRSACKTMGNVAFALYRTFSCHNAMIRYIIEQLDPAQLGKPWEVVHNVERSGSSAGPARLPEKAYSSTRLYDLLSQISSDFERELRGSKVTLNFWCFFELDPLEMPPTKSRGKRNWEYATDADSEPWTPSPKKKKFTPRKKSVRLPAVKEEPGSGSIVVKLEGIKAEPGTLGKTAVKEEDKEIDVFSDAEREAAALFAEIGVSENEEERVEQSLTKRQSGRVPRKSWKVQQEP
ncbi:hypothetical protein BGZ61DRAFT_540026 [Ilyonectria robusta]|uniref:uncharacterized protein n=1 Tax=Ilyonectria robusta TaxID=1079257 RepID=UPI001E8D1F2B|nr:uncharacterized protein BGZ61DRAFT_540026 [Ilyonectria robusta]KAH8659688.1 hypothetical protein BGZ61DRAFT_540026 [Ilyonectria robusta]